MSKQFGMRIGKVGYSVDCRREARKYFDSVSGSRKKIVLGEACYFVKFEESNEKNEFLDKEMSGENDK